MLGTARTTDFISKNFLMEKKGRRGEELIDNDLFFLDSRLGNNDEFD